MQVFSIRELRIGCCLLIASYAFSQKHDYNFIDRSIDVGSGVSFQYSDSLQDLTISIFQWIGTVARSPILSDHNGALLGYFNSRKVYDSIGRVAINGDNMAVGFYLNYLFQFLPEHRGLGNGGNCAFIPITDSLFYLFYKGPELWIGAPDFAIDFQEKGIRLSSYSQNLYLTKVRLNSDRRLYILQEEKHILLVEDLFQYRDLFLCKHSNGNDWWLITPKALNEYATRLKIKADGEVLIFDDIVFSDNFWRVRGASNFSFSPDGSMMARILARPNVVFQHIFELYDFDRCEGVFDRVLVDSLPLTPQFTSSCDVEFSDSGRFLYIAIGEIIVQLDLYDKNAFANRDTIAEWDGVLYYTLPPLFDQMWKLPNSKILVASSVATPYLHYIHESDQPGEDCLFEQRAIQLPTDPANSPFGVNIVSLPVFPPFRMAPSESPCETGTEDQKLDIPVTLYPNPASDLVSSTHAEGLRVSVVDIQGRIQMRHMIPAGTQKYDFDISSLVPGLYVFVFYDRDGRIVARKKCVKM